MRTIFISSGHSDKAGRNRGASSGKYVEGVLAVELRKLVVKELALLGLQAVVDVDNSILSESIAFFKNKTSANSIVLDIHFNAATPAAKGTETLVPANPTKFEVNLASKLSKAVATVLETSLRGSYYGALGVKTEAESARKSLGWMRLTGENVLLETCFITNPDEMRKYEERLPQLAKAIARVLYDAAIENDNLSNLSVVHVVKSGDTLSKLANIYRTSIAKIKTDNKMTSDVIQIGQKLAIKN
jgi:N-acetylmuramoyl-L-alanine amidase